MVELESAQRRKDLRERLLEDFRRASLHIRLGEGIRGGRREFQLQRPERPLHLQSRRNCQHVHSRYPKVFQARGKRRPAVDGQQAPVIHLDRVVLNRERSESRMGEDATMSSQAGAIENITIEPHMA